MRFKYWTILAAGMLAACGGEPPQAPTPEPGQMKPDTLISLPDELGLTPGAEIPVAVVEHDSLGRPRSPAKPAFKVSDTTVAQVRAFDGYGPEAAGYMVRAAAVGSATVEFSRLGTLPETLKVNVATVAFTRLATAYRVGCGVTTGAEAYCWGSNVQNWLALPYGNGSASPVRISGLHGVVDVAVADDHACALDATGTSWCWGQNWYGQLGNGASHVVNGTWVPARATSAAAFTQLVAGLGFTCALDAQHAAYCWGDNGGGQLGTGDTLVRTTPAPVAGGHAFASIGAYRGGNGQQSSDFACGLDMDGAIWCWGRNDSGQLGTGTSGPGNVPALVAGDLRFQALGVGETHACGVALDGQAHCWGDGHWGQLGQGSTASSPTPVAVSGGPNFVAISAGLTHTCALTATGQAYCWGYNASGQLGDGSTTSSSSPVAVTGGHTFASLSAGATFTCGVATDHVTYCWGAMGIDSDGTIRSLQPTRVPGQP